MKLPRLSNSQFDAIEERARALGKSLRICPTCGNRASELITGVQVWDPGTYRLDDIEYPCNCEQQIALFRHYLLARIPEEYMRLSADDYFGDANAWDQMQSYLDHWEGFKAQGLGLEFYAERQGVGKTFLATYVARELIKLGEQTYYIDFRTILNLYTKELREETEELIRNMGVLVLDEVIPPSSIAQQTFFADRFEELIRYRTNYNRVTIMTTNMMPDALEQFYPRTYSLLAAKQIRIQVNGLQDARTDVGVMNLELALNNERRPIS